MIRKLNEIIEELDLNIEQNDISDEIDDNILIFAKPELLRLLEDVELLLHSIKENGLSINVINKIKQNLHTLKGSAKTTGLNKVGLVIHNIESIFEFLIEKNKNVNIYIGSILNAITEVTRLIENPFLIQNDIIQSLTGQAKNDQEFKQKQFISISIDTINDIFTKLSEIKLLKVEIETIINENKKGLNELKLFTEKISKSANDVLLQAEIYSQIERSSENSVKKFDALELDTFTQLQETTRFLNEGIEDANDLIRSLAVNVKREEFLILEHSTLINNVLNSVTHAKLTQFNSLNTRLYKLVRTVSNELNKPVSLEINNEKIQIDRVILEKMLIPIEHLLRNCIAHGIESKAERIQQKKPVIGKIIIDVQSSGNHVFISIKDDGGGINLEKIKLLAKKKGLIQDGDEYPEKEIINLIFKPGFSTSEKLSQVAGRGVGMDIVHTEVISLGGTIDIITKKHIGTEFIIKIPTGISLMQALVVETGKQIIAIPSALIEEIDIIKNDSITSFCEKKEIHYKNKSIPFYHMADILDCEKGIHSNEQNSIVIYTKHGDKTIAFCVERSLYANEILAYSIGPVYGKIDGILGVTLFRSNEYGLIINPVLITDSFLNKKLLKNKIIQEKNNGYVLVVDDSITVRKATEKVLVKNGLKVMLAKNGNEAIELIDKITPLIILTDIEMPVMDGFDLIKTVKGSEKYSKIPIIVISSRSADKHREIVFNLGASEFLGKPYQEADLIKTISAILGN